MRATVLISSLVLVAFTVSFAQRARWVQPTTDGLGVYENEIRKAYENPIATVNSADRLQVLEEKRDHLKVKFGSSTGWVEKRLVANAARGSKTFLFDDAEVLGYLDNPTPVYIIDADDKDRDPIKLERSFAEALRENVDRETVERIAK